MKRTLAIAETGLILLVALAPVFASFPYRINIFLSWEGAYRLSEGQVPYKDFGMPVGYMYWVMPAIFFKIFGAQMITLIKAQAFMNILAGFAFRSIFKSLGVQPAIRFSGVLLFCLSYSFINYWPWYNHTVIVYELIALAFLFRYMLRATAKWSFIYPILAGGFTFFSFFTKQDAGALALLLCIALLVYHCYSQRKWLAIAYFLGGFALTAALLILPVSGYGMGYWFNHGQPPHSSRISPTDILKEFFISSQWLKFYLLIIALLLFTAKRTWKEFLTDHRGTLFTLLTLGIIAEAAIFQVTSYVPPDNNIFFHSFCFVFILSLLAERLPIRFDTWKPVIVVVAGVFLWWSSVYWKYIERFIIKPGSETYAYEEHGGYNYANVVNKNTYMIELDTTAIPMNQWRTPNLNSFRKISMPGPTVDGIERLLKLDLLKNKKDLVVLNMTELTPLAAEVPFRLETGSHYPLWFHKGVAMFDKETTMFTDRIKNNHYDLVLYEYIPYLNNFNPYKVRESLLENYKKIDSFPAPRNPSAKAWVEVYVKK
ncbi:MAG: hypothetical protein H7Y31_06190 [Chitinophagaceae bacterium]|nr:hypothetical protein [Chitinophagaceae bacterium]